MADRRFSTLISKPNDWAKTIKESLSVGREPTETKLLQLEFWNKFKEFAKNNHTKLRLRSPRPQHWYDVAIGSSIAHMSYTINTRENQIGCEIYIPKEKELFHELSKNKVEIEKILGMSLEWMELPGKNASRIKTTHESKIDNSNSWESSFLWMQETGEKFQTLFGKYIENFKID